MLKINADNLHLLKRVNVIGLSASGKSSFSKNLATALNKDFPVIEMDSLFWENDWQQADDLTFEARISEAIKGEHWVLDGSYGRTTPIKWARATAVIWLDLPLHSTLWNLTKRTFTRIKSQEDLWQTNNKESFSNAFFSKKSLYLWVLQNFHKTRARNHELFNSPAYRHIHFIHLKSLKEADAFLNHVKRLKG